MSLTLSSRQFNQDTSSAKRAAGHGPVFITDRGRTAHVLLSIQDYEELLRDRRSIVDLLADPAAARVDFEPPKVEFGIRPADFS